MPKSPLHPRLNGKPPVYTPGSGLAGKPPPPSRAQSVPSKLHASVGSRLNSSFVSTASSTSSSDQNVKLDKENVTVTVRFRPLSSKEIQKGDESTWFPNDDVTVCSEYNQAITFSYDKVFGPATTTRQVYDVAAQHVVSGAMEGIDGTVFAYGVTSSGKTHTMHGDQKSPGVIPLAIKDIFNIIQETPGREYLLRVSYLEIYNEVINDLLNPVGQNLKIREDANGPYVDKIKLEVVCAPAHVLSLIASGEAHRHVGSNNLNLMSSRSHTIFTLLIESSVRGEGSDAEVTLSQLHLIDLAGSESSKAADTHGVRKKEGSYINKSLLTLGTVISKLTDGKSTHIPYRDSKLTRLLQSSLSGHGRVSLICTVTPSSTSYEETHNTLKFAQRAKHVELTSAANKILDEKSEIKKYQKEISKLKNELEQLKREPRIETNPKMEALQTRVEEQDHEMEGLLSRIQYLNKLILVSTKNSGSNVQDRPPSHRRRYSFGEEELVFLPDKRRGLAVEDNEDVAYDMPDGSSDGKSETASNGDGTPKEEKKSKKRGMLGWFKHKKHEHLSLSTEGDVHLSNGDTTPVKRKLHRSIDQLSPLAGAVFADGRKPPPTGTTMVDEMNLLWESVRILDEEIASSTSSLKRLITQAASSPDDPKFQAESKRLIEGMQSKQQQKEAMEARIRESTRSKIVVPSQLSQQVMKLTSEVNDISVRLEMKNAENRFLQDQLESKTAENAELHVTISTLKKQLEDRNALADKKPSANSGGLQSIAFDTEEGSNWLNDVDLSRELMLVEGKAELNGVVSQGFTPKLLPKDVQSQILAQANEIEKLKQELAGVKDEKSDLERKCEKLMADAYHAQKLAESAGEDLRLLMAQATKLSEQNQELSDELEAVRSNLTVFSDENGQLDADLAEATSRLAELETCLAMKEQNEASLNKQIEEGKQREKAMESDLDKLIEEGKQREKEMENDLSGMLGLLKQARSEKELVDKEINVVEIEGANEKESVDVDVDESAVEQLKDQLETEKRKVDILELQNSQLKGDNLNNLDLSTLDDLQNVHVEALTKLYKARTKAQERIEKERLERERKRNQEGKLNFKSQPDSLTQHLVLEEERNGNICKICYESPTAAVLLPCRHFCLCKRCASACKECPICRSEIKDKIITFTS